MTEGENILRPQCTVGKEGSLSGTGLHTGLAVSLTIRPAPPGTGIVFQRTDADGSPVIQADVSSIAETRRSTTLGRNGVQVKTVEHLLAAIWALGLDNVSIELDGPEVPAFDGSALPFVETLLELGVRHQNKEAMTHILSSPLCLARDDAYILALPTDGGLSFTYVAEFSHPLIGTQRFDLRLDPECFAREIAPARTFGFLEEVQELYANDLARGASLQNSLVVGQDSYMSPPRFADEVVRHKLLDLIGDLALTGCRFDGVQIVAVRTSHKVNVEFARSLAERSRQDEGGR